MTITYSFTVIDAKNDALETAIGTAPKLRVYSGTMPTNARTALSGNTLLAEGSLPSDWLGASSSGVKSKAGSWSMTGQSGAGTGTVGTFYRIYDTAGTNCHEQGTFGTSGTDMTADNASIANAQVITVNSYAKTSGNI